ncbi:ryanodine receptor 1 [Tursiops truncatus]|uniref:ryanodine receptor 1 n=1 Tax=Tursiops truncatus TaxID=9739 RepID=UPI003CCFDA17
MGDGGEGEDEVQFLRTDDEMVLQCSAMVLKEQLKLCLAAEGFGNRLCFLEPTSNAQNVPPDLAICCFVLEQSLSVRALQEMLANTVEAGVESSQGGGHRTLLYGHAILLRHSHSGMYLSCLTTSRSMTDKLAFDVGLQEDATGEACWWTTHPASKQRSEGEKVRVGDDLILVSVSSERYLHLSTASGELQVDASFMQTLWNMNPICSGCEEGYVTGGHVLRLFHGHMDECLTISPADSDDQRRLVYYEGGSVCTHARSLWRLEPLRISWSGSHLRWGQPLRIRHVTTGRYLALIEDQGLVVVDASKAHTKATSFCFRISKEKLDTAPKRDVEGMGPPEIKYGESLCFVQHVASGLWLTYAAPDPKALRLGVLKKKAILHQEGHMDDALSLTRCQQEESQAARMIYSTGGLYNHFIKGLDSFSGKPRGSGSPAGTALPLEGVILSLQDLIGYFEPPSEELQHEEKQGKLRSLRNRQSLFQEEGMLSLVLNCIDRLNVYTTAAHFAEFAGEEAAESWKEIVNLLYEILASLIRGNRANCALFSNNLDWLVSKLDRLEASSGILEVLYCVLIESPEVLNIIQENHIKSIISLLDKHGRNHKVLDVLCSLCVCNGVAVRSNQDLITENLLPGRELLLQTNLINFVTSIRPNIFVGRAEGSTQYLKWYFEVMVDEVAPFLTAQATHLRVGWALTEGYSPYPGGGEGWGGNGVGDDLYSYGFDGLHLWTGHVPRLVTSPGQHLLAPEDVVSCCLDLSVPSISFRINGCPVQGVFEAFNLDGLFFPVVSFSAGVKVRFLLGGRHGEFKFLPPPGYAPCHEAVLPRERLHLEPIKEYRREGPRGPHLVGPSRCLSHTDFVPCPVDTVQIVLPPHLEGIREKLAENIHELWALTRIEQGWTYGPVRDDNKRLHPCLVDFHSLPEPERNYNLQMSGETLKTLLALGCHVGMADEKAEDNLKKTKLPKTYMMSNGYKPAPLDLSHVRLTPAQTMLVDRLAENGHNVWARDRVAQGWTYSSVQDIPARRNPRLVPYRLLDEATKRSNRDSLCQAVRTLLGYGYNIEPPDQEPSLVESQSRWDRVRIFRAEKSYVVQSGRWYFEFEAVTTGEMRVGWARPELRPDVELGADELAYVFNGHRGQRWHLGSEPFGRPWQSGDVVGCMIDLTENTIIFTLNGEVLMSDSGSETAFRDIEIGDGFLPVCSLGPGQVGHLNLGQDVSSLRFFTICGLQEGFEPFAINMQRPVTTWFSKSLPQFQATPPEHPHYEVTRVDGTVDTPPCLRLTHRTWGSQNSLVEMLFLRLSLPVQFHQHFRCTAGATPLAPPGLQPPAEDEARAAEPDPDYENLRRSAGHWGEAEGGKEGTAKEGSPGGTAQAGVEAQPPRAENEKDATTEKNKKRGFLFKAKKAAMMTQPPATPTLPRLPREVMPADDRDDPEIILNTTTYYYSVRVFAGQEPSCVWVGWVTPDYHQHDMNFDLSKVRVVTVTMGDEQGNIHSSLKCSNCYMVWGGDFVSPGQQGRISHTDLVIGCLVDLATGLMTFTANGKESNTFFQVEPNTKLFPAVFVLPTHQNVIQFELGKQKNIMPLSAAMFLSERKNPTPQCPPRLEVQMLMPVSWSRMPNHFLQVDTWRAGERLGWAVQCQEPLTMMALHIPEENRCMDILELSERLDLQRFHSHTLRLYCAVCALGNNRVAHALCSHVDQAQLLHALEDAHLPGPLRAGYYDLLISIHLESACRSRRSMLSEYIVPLTPETRAITLFPPGKRADNGPRRYSLPGVGVTTSLRPPHHFLAPCFVAALPAAGAAEAPSRLSPSIPLEALRDKALRMLGEAVRDGGQHARDPVGGSVEFQFVPVLKLVSTLLVMGIFGDEDVKQILKMIEPEVFTEEEEDEEDEEDEEEKEEDEEEEAQEKEDAEQEEEEAAEGDKEEDLEEGLLQMKLPESVKLQMCHLLEYFCDQELQHRVESLAAFAERYVDKLQANQRDRYSILVKAFTMTAAETARRTREFRSPPQEQINMLLHFKDADDEEDCPVPEEIRQDLLEFHQDLLTHCGIQLAGEEEEPEEEATLGSRLMSLLEKVRLLKKKEEKPEEEPPAEEHKPQSLQELVSHTVVRWAHEDFVQSPELVRAMFSLLHRQYDGLGELLRALPRAYTISPSSVEDTMSLLECLGQIRSLLIVQMGLQEENLMIQSIGNIMNNKVFYQHPNLMRALGMHETVMEVMVNVLGGGESKEIRFPKMVTSCCRFLCYFCRISRQNQRSMFDHLSYLLENSGIGLGMQGSTPLDVAAASVIDNNELALALQEQDLEKVVSYLAGCGLQSCPILLAKGYPDIGWNPCGGERYLDFLRFAVFVNGESVEENANVVVRLLIRKPECFGPALRGEGSSGLLATIEEAIRISEDPARDGPGVRRDRRRELFGEEPPEENRVHLGHAIMSFYAALIDLLGRCAPEMHLIEAGKGEALRIRAILRSLVPLDDLVGIISLPLQIPTLGKDGALVQPKMSASFVPDHKASMVLFLDRVYGIENQEFLLHVLDVGFLPDMRAAASLDTATFSTTEMALALNRYLCLAVLPLITKCAPLFAGTEHRAIMVDSMLHTVYRLSRGRSLTKAQRDVIEECLMALCRYIRPSMLQHLLRRLVFDVPILNEFAKMPLKLLTNHYERCWKYYCLPTGWANYGVTSEEELHLTRKLFWGIFDSLAHKKYDPELYRMAMPCLCAIAGALPPDYVDASYSSKAEKKATVDAEGNFDPRPVETLNVIIPEKLDSFINKFAEYTHEKWAFDKIQNNWSYGENIDEELKTHPMLRPYKTFSEKVTKPWRPRNVVNGMIARQMVDMLVESSSNVEMILKFFDMFLKLKDIVGSEAFQDYVTDPRGLISKKDFQKAMDSQKQFTGPEIQFLLSCSEADENEMIDCEEFANRFQEPARDIGFNVAVLLTNLSEHVPHDPRLRNFLELAESILEYFRPYLGRIEIMGASRRIERIYFEISETNRAQWEMPQVKESKRQFIFDVVNEGGESEKMELFVSFCEDTIFEMQIAAQISETEGGPGEDDDEGAGAAEAGAEGAEEGAAGPEGAAGTAAAGATARLAAAAGRALRGLSYRSLRRRVRRLRRLTAREAATAVAALLWAALARAGSAAAGAAAGALRLLWGSLFGGGLVEGAKKVTMTELLAGMPDPTGDEVHGEQPAGPGGDVDGEGAGEGAGDSAEGVGDEEAAAQEVGPEGPDGTVAVAEDGPFRPEGAGGLGDMGDTTPAEPPTPEGSPIIKRKLGVDGEEEEVPPEPEPEKADAENGEKKEVPEPPPEPPKKTAPPPPPPKKEEAGGGDLEFWGELEVQRVKFLNYLSRNFYTLRFLALFLAFAINFILLFYKVSDSPPGEDDVESSAAGDLSGAGSGGGSGWGSGAGEEAEGDEDENMVYYFLEESTGYMEPALRCLSLLHTLVAFLCIIGYNCLKVPLVIFKREKELARKLEFDGLYITEQPEDDDVKGQWDRLVLNTPSFPSNYWDKFVKRKVLDKHGDIFGRERIAELLGMDLATLEITAHNERKPEPPPGLLTWLMSIDIKYQIWKFGVIFTDNSFLYLGWYMVMSLLGHYNNFFFAAHLLDIAMGVKTLRTILSSVTHNGKQLVMTVGLLAVVVYLYTVVAFNFFRKFYNKSEDEDEPDMKCDDMMTCYLFHMYVGVRAGGGIGDEIEDPAGDEYELYRVVFDITFFFFVIVILLAIIQGLIIDAFGELRDQQEQVKEDMETKCFICGIGSDYFDSTPHGFETHTLEEHNLANYMFFLMYLINKDETEHTGQESYVWKMYQERCWDFFPAGDCFRKQYEDQLS